jgi:hypothetical protein
VASIPTPDKSDAEEQIMPSGLNQVCNIIRFSYPQDDAVGGAVPSGTVLYSNLDIRIASEKPVMAIVQQGIQTEESYSALLFEGNVDIRHNDQIEVILPVIGWFYGKKFRVVGIQRSSSHPYQERNQIRLTLKRSDESHGNSYQ